jgi:multidrug efflux pump subunit AcrB
VTLRQSTIVLATVCLIVGTGLAVFRVRINQSAAYRIPQTIVVEAVYPGADARTVADTVAAPFEQQVNGIENLLSMSSLSTNDGRYRLQLEFATGSNLDTAQVLVQNRITLAIPVLPQLVQQEGVQIRKKSSEPLLLIGLTSPGDRHDDVYLGNYATNPIKDELARVPGISDISLIGKRNVRVQVLLDADKLEKHQLTAEQMVDALSPASLIGQPPALHGPPLTITMPGSVTEPKHIEKVILKAFPNGEILRLCDVARVELTRNETGDSSATLNGHPAVVLSLYPISGTSPLQVSQAVADKVAELRAHLPDGIRLETIFDFAPSVDSKHPPTSSEHLVIDVGLAENTTAKRASQVLERAAEVVQHLSGVQDVLTLSEHPFSFPSEGSCLIVRLSSTKQHESDRQLTANAVRDKLQSQFPDATFRISLPSLSSGFPVYGFPIDMVIENRGELDDEEFFKRLDALSGAMTQSAKFMDVMVGTGPRLVSSLHFEIDRVKCTALEVDVNTAFKTVQAAIGPGVVSPINKFDSKWSFGIRLSPAILASAPDLVKLQVKNQKGQIIPLATVISVRQVTSPMVIARHNLYRSERITANRAAEVSLNEARSLCEHLAAQELEPQQLKLVWRTP